MVREHPKEEWRTIGGVEIWFNQDGLALRADIDGQIKYPYVWNPKTRVWDNAFRTLTYSAVKSRTQRGTIRWA